MQWLRQLFCMVASSPVRGRSRQKALALHSLRVS